MDALPPPHATLAERRATDRDGITWTVRITGSAAGLQVWRIIASDGAADEVDLVVGYPLDARHLSAATIAANAVGTFHAPRPLALHPVLQAELRAHPMDELECLRSVPDLTARMHEAAARDEPAPGREPSLVDELFH